MNKLMIVVPCYNEQEVLPTTIGVLSGVLQKMIDAKKIDEQSCMLLVNDGSRDTTWEIIAENHATNKLVSGLNLAGNVGHQNALIAGLEVAMSNCDMSVSIDADLQDDVGVIEEMVDKYIAGADIVYGVRNDRSSDSFFKRFTAQSFYKAINKLGAKTVYNHADFRLMSKRAMEAMLKYNESHMFIRGIIPKLGFNTDMVYYSRKERMAGESKYPLKKMISFAWDGITSLSIKPISIVTTIGGIIIFCSIMAFIYTLISYILGTVEPGWSSTMISIWFLGGVQLFSIGLVGQYVGKTYIESKHRPRYHIEKVLLHENKD